MIKARRSARVPTTATGSCRTARGVQWDIELADLSQGGCQIEDPQGRLRLGEHVRLTIAGTGPHMAEIAWRQGALIGVEFVRPLPERVLARLAAADGPVVAPVRRLL
ncbi:MAG: PilZ domain-containing protein [Erythrobacter sp.]|nr:PilZ domain-containing protein [Erythrobacter sp.]